MAHLVSERATCDRLHVGVVLVDPYFNTVISTGYNGAPAGMKHCTDVGCLMIDGHCLRVLHAEENALILAAKTGAVTEGSHAYCIYLPCLRCSLRLFQGGINEVWFQRVYGSAPITDELLTMYREADVKLIQVSEDMNECTRWA